MKRERIMKTAALLLVAALVTTWGINGIYAKYSTSGTRTGEVTVAKWGVTITNKEGDNAFVDYEGDDTGDEGALVSSSGDCLMAPGTRAVFNSLEVSGTPEVNVTVSNKATISLSGWTYSDKYYCPIEVTVGTTTMKGMNYDSASDFKDAIEAAVEGYEHDYDAGTDLSDEPGAVPVIKWKWAEKTVVGGKAMDEADTALSELDTPPSFSITLKTTVNQNFDEE